MKRLMLIGVLALATSAAVSTRASAWRLRYREAADWSAEGWRTSALPLGNGHFGVAMFGGTDVERLQLTAPSFQTRALLWKRPDWPQGNMTDAAIDACATRLTVTLCNQELFGILLGEDGN